MATGRIHQLSISCGGVPKLPVESADVTPLGLSGDRQRDAKHHGGPERAVCMFSLEVIDRLRAEGHPIFPGAVGENVTIEGVDWPAVGPGSRFVFDRGVQLEVATFTAPCSGIRNAFRKLEFNRIKQSDHQGDSRVYARVLRTGSLRRGEGVTLAPPSPTYSQSMLTPEAARRFADAWYRAWNAHDLDAIMALYAPPIEHSSPFIARYTNDPACAPLRGKDAVRAYFARALERNPALAFHPLHLGVGVSTVNLVYRRMSGDLAVEVFFFDETGKVSRSISHYEPS